MRTMGDEIGVETGSNELELMEFIVGGNNFGINIAKIRELIQFRPVQPLPNAQPYVEGVICPREEIFTVVDLAAYLHLPASADSSHDIFIITDFNQIYTAFHVHSVVGICRLSWEAIQKPDNAVFGGEDGVITGIAKTGTRMISIVDFEKIMTDINPNDTIASKAALISDRKDAPVQSQPILIVEDSAVLRRMILDSLHKAGYANVTVLADGKEAWEYLEEVKKEHSDVPRQVACVITDIEMPQMDGHTLTKYIKTDPCLSAIPVLIFSSLISDEMRKKGEEVGADGQISKPQIHSLVELMEAFLK